MQASTNKFYIVATPIGNLEDITLRALRILGEVDIILCEDTRTTRKLLQNYTIATPTESYHAQSSQNKEDTIINRIKEGKTFALVSDAGTPTISDPGVRLMSRIWDDCKDTVQIISLPGPSAVITALAATGFTGNQFTFYGFLPHKKGRNTVFDTIEKSKTIAVFYESPHRIMKTLAELDTRFGKERRVAVGRELTKIYEETVRGSAFYVHNFFKDNPDHVRGECVVIVEAI